MTAAQCCYSFTAAIVRAPSHSVVHGLRAADHGNPDYHELLKQHDAYRDALRSAGLETTVLPPLEDYPDSIFVEDVALVFSQGAILLRPGAATRQGESEQIKATLNELFATVLTIPPPGRVDGGDVLVLPEAVVIGLSGRTDRTGAAALADCLAAFGLRSEIARTPPGGLHFKSECSLVDEETVLVTRRLASLTAFAKMRRLVVPEGEEPAANVLRINHLLLASAGYPRTLDLLDQHGSTVVPLETSEIEKIDAGLTCMSLRWYR
ncbi:dimethylarginine dimethylaminohydrolase family protein [Desulfofustis limnaeus]|jgi:dimethylargininase|uniref:N(G),N(G)-dimethylarginine dimethylaminohydrolase n=1 Tax=Desulfofustis limnaeus TaxID=2740163 RepID=A0ABN6M9I7_9BACT|nr:arginine deiminase family protein [Desulfofustis limnaeus]MDX9895846.1 arginine deiminase family protein [Desulfofustis sp.]BDD88431.1 N(G),N(G)-dimethylarginine dimethylaminohydrolase [Desulfofustis limnaeus]